MAGYLNSHGIDVDEVTGEARCKSCTLTIAGYASPAPGLLSLSAQSPATLKRPGEQQMSQHGTGRRQCRWPGEPRSRRLTEDDSTSWDGPESEKHVWAWAGESADGTPNFAKARPMFGVVVGDGSKKDDYKAIHHDIRAAIP